MYLEKAPFVLLGVKLLTKSSKSSFQIDSCFRNSSAKIAGLFSIAIVLDTAKNVNAIPYGLFEER